MIGLLFGMPLCWIALKMFEMRIRCSEKVTVFHIIAERHQMLLSCGLFVAALVNGVSVLHN